MYKQTDIQKSYDRIATQYAENFFNELSRKPFDCQVLERFAENIARQGPVWDVGCGPGQVGRYLQERGLTLYGLDLSEQMLTHARVLNPQITFLSGSMLSLPTPDGTLAGIVSFYAIIHLTRVEAIETLQEFWRALQPGGYLLLAFHGGEGEVQRQDWFGEEVMVSATLFGEDEMVRYTREAGFTILDLLERPPYDFEHPSLRVYLYARKPE